MGLFSFIKKLFNRNKKVEDVEKVMNEIKSIQEVQMNGSVKFPKKVGKAEINVESKPEESTEKKSKVNNFVHKNNKFFSEKASKGKRKYSSYNKKSKRNYNKKKDK